MSATYSSNLKALRLRRGLTQQEVAMRLGIKRSTYSSFENEGVEPRHDLMVAISRVFGVGVDVMLRRPDGGPPTRERPNYRAVRAVIEEMLIDRCTISELRDYWRKRIDQAWSASNQATEAA